MRKTHGMKGTPEYSTWTGMLKRCRNPKHNSWKNYGGRGISVKFASFEEFFAEIGPKPSPDLSVDRIDNDGNYESGNIRWATRSEQRMNTRPRKPQRGYRRTLQTHCPRGHTYTAENSLQQSHDKRRCKQCYQEYQRRKNRKKNVKRFARDRLNTAARRYIKRFGGVVLLHGLPPLIPHDCLPVRWPATAETALILAQKVAAYQYG